MLRRMSWDETFYRLMSERILAYDRYGVCLYFGSFSEEVLTAEDRRRRESDNYGKN